MSSGRSRSGGDQFLAGARFTQEQYGGVGGGDLLRLLQDQLDGSAAPQDFWVTLQEVQILAQRQVLGLQTLLERFDFRQGLAEALLDLAAVKSTGEDFCDQAEAVDQRLRPLPFSLERAKRECPQHLPANHERERHV
jgi:hypothetical protein